VAAIGRRPKPEIWFLAGAVEVNDLAQGALRRLMQWPRIEYTTFDYRGEHSTLSYLYLQTLLSSLAFSESNPSQVYM